MNEVRFVVLQPTGKRCIGTSDLNGCTVVAIVSPYAAILAHIPSTPDVASPSPQAGDRNVRAKIDEVAILFHQHTNYFPSQSTTWVVSAVYEGIIALPDQKVIIEEKLQQMGLVYAQVIYVVKRAGEPRPPAHGTVFVDARGGSPVVYVDDRRVN